MDTPKQKLYNQCVALIKEKRDKIEANITLLQASLTSESKSTAGDKHETCLLYTSPSPRDKRQSRMPSSA